MNLSSKVQNVLKHLIQFNLQGINIPGKTYKIEEVRMGSLSVIKNDFSNLDQMQVVLSDQEVLNEFLPDVVLQLSNLEVIY